MSGLDRIFDVAVIGAGLTGSCVALELAADGLDVLLIDQDPIPINRASLRNEGKIHLGFVYAADLTMATARLQVEGALSFSPLLRRWLGRDAADIPLSTPFHYSVAKESILPSADIEAHFGRVAAVYGETVGSGWFEDYLGTSPAELFRPIPVIRPEAEIARYETAELAIHTGILADRIRRALAAHPRIRFLGGSRVDGIDERGGGLELVGVRDGERWLVTADSVVNAAWDGQIALDRTAGVEYPAGWVHRLKYRVIARIPETMRHSHSLTIVTGRFGDVVIRHDGTAYLSWYPAGLLGWSTDDLPPLEWNDASRGLVSHDLSARIFEAFLEGLVPWYPDVRKAEPVQVDAGVIVAHGSSDVDDPSSGLHTRTTAIGVRSKGRYHSVNPGKLTTAPLHAWQAARLVREETIEID